MKSKYEAKIIKFSNNQYRENTVFSTVMQIKNEKKNLIMIE
jgi:hypothetical protein